MSKRDFTFLWGESWDKYKASPHRTTEVKDFNRDEFLEEVVDAFNYFFSLLVLTGVSAEELFDAYSKKDKIIHDRLKTGY